VGRVCASAVEVPHAANSSPITKVRIEHLPAL
jgi:hypothetical protein